MNKASFLASLMMALTVLLSVGAQAQEQDVPKVEVGVQFSSLTSIPQSQQGRQGQGLTVDIGRTEAAFGGRFTFNLTKNFALEAEGNFFPQEKFSGFFNEGNLLQGQLV